jgi:hypothetical protein
MRLTVGQITIFLSLLLNPAGIPYSQPIPDMETKYESMPDNFNLILKFGYGERNILDTFKSTFTKDMVVGPDTTIKLILDKSELNSIFNKMLDIDFFSYPELFEGAKRASREYFESKSKPDSLEVHHDTTDSVSTTSSILEYVPYVAVHPSQKYYFEVQCDTIMKELRWNDEVMGPDADSEKLRDLIQLIQKIIYSKPEVKALPFPRGAYE